MTVTVITTDGKSYEYRLVGVIRYLNASGMITITFKSPATGWLNAYFKASEVVDIMVWNRGDGR